MNRGPGNRKSNPENRGPSESRGASPLVGRDGELRHLATRLERAAEGHGGTIFLAGQPGIGTTRLAREALAQAKQQGFFVLEGRAYSLDARLAYAPILDAFGPYLRSCSPSRLANLANGLPDLGRLFTDLRLRPPVLPPERLGDPALEKTRLFEAVSRLLGRLTQEAPVALFIDDAHWADCATLELLHYLARGLGNQRALLLATCRADDLDTLSDWQEMVESLRRAGLAEQVVVPELEPDALDKLARSIIGEQAPAELLCLLRSRAAGTPLFVEAFIDALVDSGRLVHRDGGWILDAEKATILPPTIHRLIRGRLLRLSLTDRRILDLIAVLGDATSHTVLRAASEVDEGTLLEVMLRLRAAGLIAEQMEGSDVVYSITHPLVQEVACAELPEMMRRRAHMAAIEAMESVSKGRPADVSRLAHHYCNAGPAVKSGRALAALVQAGDQALVRYANEEAARHFEAALAMAREGLEDLPSTLPDILERLGEACERIGKREAAVKAWNEALTQRERAGDATAASRLRRQLALVEWDRGHFDMANAHLSAGLIALADSDPSQELADLHFARSQILGRLGDVAGVGETVARLASLAERLASPTAEGEANLAASFLFLWQNDVTNARQRALRALLIGESFPEGQGLAICCRAHIALVVTGMRLGDHHFVREHAERGLAVIRRLGDPKAEVFLHLYLAFANLSSGDWDESLRSSVEAVALARRVGSPRDLGYSLAQRAMILALRGNFAKAEGSISEARMAFGGGIPADGAFSGFVQIVEATLALEQGQVERALHIARGFVDPTGPEAAVRRRPAYAPMALMLLAEAQLAAGDPQAVAETASKLIDLGPTGTPHLMALASRVEGLARQALGQPEAAKACLKRAYENFTVLDMPFEAARALFDQATLATRTRPDLAIRAARKSLAIFERLGAQRYAERARRLLGELSVSPPARRRPHLGGVRVSERELEIARLVARGLTNPEVAERLTLTPGTVGVHLHRIYGRLGIGSRAALAGLVTEAGLNSLQENVISKDYWTLAKTLSG